MAKYDSYNGGGGEGPQGLHFAYQPQWPSDSYAYANSASNLDQPGILDQTDYAMMANFFSDPDASMATDSYFPLHWQNLDQKVGQGQFDGPQDDFENDSRSAYQPSTTLADTLSPDYRSRLNGNTQHVPVTTPQAEFGSSNHTHQAADDDNVRAASSLYSMFMNGQDTSHGAAMFDGTAGGSWGSFGTGQPTMHMQELRSPLTSSGRQSSNSHHSQPHTQPHMSQQYANGQAGQSQTMPQNLYQQGMLPVHHVPRARPAPLQLETPHLNSFPQHQTQSPLTPSGNIHGQGSSRPGMVRFGSDSNFGSNGYRGPSSGMPLEDAKSGNLTNVPFAAQAAANGSSHVHPFTPVSARPNFGYYNMPSGRNAYNNTSALPSPNTLGGLPVSNMAPNANRHSHPFHQMAPQLNQYEDVELEEDEFEEAQPRKRCKSQMERDDDATYRPATHHVKTPTSKRGFKATKASALVDSDDDDEYQEVTSSANKSSIKRRQSSTTKARPSSRPSTSQSNSPADMTSPAAGKAGGRKKSRSSNPRQNLSEEEKRRNHIASEKNRRDLIKVQYDALDSMVPALKGGKSGLSRADVLSEIVAYVQSVIDGNEKAEQQIAEKVAMREMDAGEYG